MRHDRTSIITVYVTLAEKRKIAEWAQLAGTSIGEYLRQAALRPAYIDKALEHLIDLANNHTDRAIASINQALYSIEESSRRIADFEANHQPRL